eukprot:SAG11_NODE_259_length_11534_cov_3.402361_13_plen_248_part_00
MSKDRWPNPFWLPSLDRLAARDQPQRRHAAQLLVEQLYTADQALAHSLSETRACRNKYNFARLEIEALQETTGITQGAGELRGGSGQRGYVAALQEEIVELRMLLGHSTNPSSRNHSSCMAKNSSNHGRAHLSLYQLRDVCDQLNTELATKTARLHDLEDECRMLKKGIIAQQEESAIDYFQPLMRQHLNHIAQLQAKLLLQQQVNRGRWEQKPNAWVPAIKHGRTTQHQSEESSSVVPVGDFLPRE